jgi:hypothetical protein
MATLALAAAGAAAGSALLPTGLSILGATISGATIGAQAGALAGAFVDQSLFAASGRTRSVTGPRLSDLRVMASSEGAAIPRVYGRARVGGQVIWATDFEEEAVTTDAGGGKGGATGTASVRQTDYRYFANFAVALAAGEISGVGRIWADGSELDLSGISYRVHTGSETQVADSLIVARMGGDAPAYRGVAYVVFERLALAAFGNRLPQLSFEVFRGGGDLASLVKGVVLIPGSGEFFAATSAVTRIGFAGQRVAENVHTSAGVADAEVSLDQLQSQLPNVGSVSLVASWFGTDLRCGQCQIVPKVEIAQKDTSPVEWSVAGLTRSTATTVSRHQAKAAYGGTPSDQTIVDQIRSLHARGLSVTINPFVLMDIAADNALPNPLDGSPAQPAYPWRGRITCDPAPGRPGTADKTAAAGSQLANFIGAAEPGDFALSGDTVIYSGPTEWSYRRFILHYAWLAKAAGNVAAFLIGSELRGLTTVRSGPSSYPFVTALRQLAADVRAILGPAVKITYAADWSEYFGHQPADGSGDVHFHLDPLWASADIDAIGIDVYWPLADWRDGPDHLDRVAGARSIHDLAYLKSNIAAGEGYDWYYASDADRIAQVRTPVTDGLGKPWIFRFKDLRSWWLNSHYDRPGGIESAVPTVWVPQSKPVWFMETGCGAVDKAANQPNVFVDPKSAESALPYHSSGRRDDLMQRRYLQAMLAAYDASSGSAVAGLNPISAVYGGAMVAAERTHVYAWDLRPYPAFPADVDTWGDGGSWRLGHWLNGRIASISLSQLVERMAADFGSSEIDAAALEGIVPGYVVDRIMSLRDAMQPLELAYFFDSVETGGLIRLRHRGAEPVVARITEDLAVETSPGAAAFALVRGQETDLPASAKLTFISGDGDYRQAVTEARRLTGASGRVAQADLPIVLDPDAAGELAESWLFEAWASRERASFVLPPSRLAVEPGDALLLDVGGRRRMVRVTEVADHGARAIDAMTLDPQVYARAAQTQRTIALPPPIASGQPEVRFLDLPLLTGDEPATSGYIAAAQQPWPGPLAVYRSPEAAGFELQDFVSAASPIGVTLDPLPVGPEGRMDLATKLRVALSPDATLASVTRLKLLSGANIAAVQNAAGDWEVLQFETAILIAPGTYELSSLLRGQAGTETALSAPALSAGATFVLISPALKRLDLVAADVGLPFTWRIGPAARDLGSETFLETRHAFSGLGARPLSPVHVRGRRSAGDLAISWVRRTRSGGDSWTASEVPLSEEYEAYEVDIVNGATVKRTIAVSQPAATYTAAQQIADFGATQASIAVRICQMSAVWGRGAMRAASI